MARSATGGRRRKPKRREQRRRFLIACEGDKEVAYFKWLNKRLGGSAVLTPMRHWSAPEHVLALAIRERDGDRQAAEESGDSEDVYDGVWMVVDVDQYTHLEEVLANAERAGVDSAVSGPCFEVWLILHKEEHVGTFSNSKAAKDQWAKIVGPTRTLQQEFERTDSRLAVAVSRADILLARHERDGIPRHRRNPSTEVGLLVKAVTRIGDIDIRTL